MLKTDVSWDPFGSNLVCKLKFLAKKMFKTKVLCIYNNEGKYVINMEIAPESITSN